MSDIAFINEELRQAAANLPTSYETRWTNAKKAAVVHAVQGGVISLERALALYRMSRQEFESWKMSCAPLGQSYSGLRQMRRPAQPARRDQPSVPDQPARRDHPVLRPVM